MKKAIKILCITLASIVGLVLVLVLVALGVVQYELKPERGNKLLDEYLPQFVDAKAQYDSINLDIFNTFPNVHLDLGGVLVRTLAFGDPDTLLYVKNIEADANLVNFIANGKIHVNKLIITDPYIKAQKKDSIYSWDVVEPSDEVDTTATSLPEIYADTLYLGKALVKYTDYDSHFNANISGLEVNSSGTEFMPELLKSKIDVLMESVSYMDSVKNRKFNMDGFKIEFNAFKNDTITNLLLFNALSDKVCLKDSTFDIKGTPFDIYARATADSAFKKYYIDTLGVKLDETALTVKGGATLYSTDTLKVGAENLRLWLNCPSLWRLTAFVPSQYAKDINKLVFDGALKLYAKARGVYEGNNLPIVEANVELSKFNGGFKKYKKKINRVDLKAHGRYNQNIKDSTFVNIEKLLVETEKNKVQLSGDACYKGGREYVDLELLADIDLKVVNEIYKFEPKQKMRGTLNADIAGNCFLDDIKNKNIYQIFTKSVITGDKIGILLPSMKLGVYVDSLNFALNTNTSNAMGGRKARTHTALDSARIRSFLKKQEGRLSNKTKIERKNANDTVLLSSRLSFSSLNVWYTRKIKAKSERFSVSLTADDLAPKKVPYIRASVAFGGIDITAGDSLKFLGKKMNASATIGKNAKRPNVPSLSLRVALDSLLACTPDACATLDSTRMNFAISPRLKLGMKRGMTALQRDSVRAAAKEKVIDLKGLFSTMDTVSKSKDAVETFIKRFTNSASVYVKRLRLKQVDFPLRTSVSRFDIEMNDDTIRLNSIRPRIGRSAVTLSGEVTNIRKYLFRGRTLDANLKLKSKRVDLNQIMNAFYTYNTKLAEKEQLKADIDAQAQVMEDNAALMRNEASAGDEELELASDSVELMGLIVLPERMNLKFTSNIDTLKFSKMNLVDFRGLISLKEQRLKIKEMSTSTQVGKAQMNVMYACAVPDSARAALALNMDSIQVGDLVTYMPELDSILPMLRSFDGSLKCNLSAEATLGSTMDIRLPSVNASLRLRGDSLVLMDGETFSEIAKLLMFNKKTKNRIDSISVDVTVKNNEILIYPFMVGMDKYRLGVGGTQNLDMSFKYHIVLLKSPILQKLAVDVYGKDFDHIKFRLATPKFKDFNVSIGKGGTLIKENDTNICKIMYDAMLDAILKEE